MGRLNEQTDWEDERAARWLASSYGQARDSLPAHSLLDVALEAAQRGGEVLTARFGRAPRGVAEKDGPTNLVSDADREAERVIRQVLNRARPRDTVTGEEQGTINGESPIHWIVDPLDGTENFLRGLLPWAVSVAAEDHEGPAVGVIVDPSRREAYSAVRSGGATVNGEPLQPQPRCLRAALLVTSRIGYPSPVEPKRTDQLRALFSAVGKVRSLGSVALSLAWTAAGRCDLCFFESRRLALWDVAAGLLICREAGLTTRLLAPAQDGLPHRILAGHEAVVDIAIERLS